MEFFAGVWDTAYDPSVFKTNPQDAFVGHFPTKKKKSGRQRSHISKLNNHFSPVIL